MDIGTAMAIGAGINFLGGLFGGSQGASYDAAAQRRQYQYNLALQQQQQSWNESMWSKVQAYNTPAMQKSRLIDAGLNPNLAYGSLTGNVAQNVPGGGLNSVAGLNSSPQMAAQFQNALNIPATVMKQMSESNLMEHQARLVDQKVTTETYNALNESLKYDYGKAAFEDKLAATHLTVDKLRSDIKLNESQAALNEVNKELAPQYFELAQTKNKAEVDQIYGNLYISLQDLQIRKNIAPYQMRLLAAQAKQAIAESKNLDSRTVYQNIINKWEDWKSADESVIRDLSMQLMKGQKTGLDYDNWMKSYQNEVQPTKDTYNLIMAPIDRLLSIGVPWYNYQNKQ